MSSTTVQCFVLFLALLQLGEIQGEQGEGQQPIDEVLNESEGAELCSRAEVRELRQEVSQITQTLSQYLDAITRLQEKVEEASNNHSREVTQMLLQYLDANTRLQEKVEGVEEASNHHSREVSQTLKNMERQLDMVYQYTYVPPSCKNISAGSPSGTYTIQGVRGTTRVYCDMTRECCGSRGGWMRVAHLDMTDHNQQCPPGFRLITSPRRTCGRPTSGCVSTTFPVHGVEYRKVCGRIIGYQYYSPDGFHPYYVNRRLTIDDLYVEGVSLTHGSSPRKHIWTFAAAVDETRSNSNVCPCTRPDLTYTGVVPPFIGQDYFCETGSRSGWQRRLYTEDPLWDGRGCGSVSTCCSFNNPPWFCKELPQPTTDDIELRVCGGNPLNNEDTPLELLELYVQ